MTKELKDYYQKDFLNNVEPCNDSYWKLDQGVLDYLVKINKNSSVHSLYSKMFSPNDSSFIIDQESYLRFAFKQEVENLLFREIIPRILMCANLSTEGKCFYQFEAPKDNLNYSELYTGPLQMGCVINPDYFRVNSIKLLFNSKRSADHVIFWDIISNELVALNKDTDVT